MTRESAKTENRTRPHIADFEASPRSPTVFTVVRPRSRCEMCACSLPRRGRNGPISTARLSRGSGSAFLPYWTMEKRHPNHPGELSTHESAATRKRTSGELEARAGAIDAVAEAGVPFVVGGAYAYGTYTGIYRD